MEQLRVIGNEDGKLILATESGERFSVPVDEVLRAEVRRSQRDRDPSSRAARPSPRDIQAQIRSGLSTAEVAAVLGIELEDVVRYERPVLAEREFIVGQALSVPVLLGGDFDHDGPATFGTAVRAKLAEAGATDERWSSWKDETGWVVKLEFAAGEVERDARWSFDPRRSTLAPLNADATQLSRQGAMPEGLIPRLRALDVPGLKDESRFDSAAFGPRRTIEEPEEPTTSPTGPVPHAHSAAQDAAIKRAPTRRVRRARPLTFSKLSVVDAVNGSLHPIRAAMSSLPHPSHCSTPSSRDTKQRSQMNLFLLSARPRDARRATLAAARAVHRCRPGTRSSSAHAPTNDYA